MLGWVARHRPSIIIGHEQGGTIAALSALPLVLEAACRARIVTTSEIGVIRQAWAGVRGIFVISPILLPQRTEFKELVAAIPEMQFMQPRGVMRTVIQS